MNENTKATISNLLWQIGEAMAADLSPTEAVHTLKAEIDGLNIQLRQEIDKTSVLEGMPAAMLYTAAEMPIGLLVRKIKGAEYSGRVVGYYSTALNPNGVCVESEHHAGTVQIYPMTMLAAVPHAAALRLARRPWEPKSFDKAVYDAAVAAENGVQTVVSGAAEIPDALPQLLRLLDAIKSAYINENDYGKIIFDYVNYRGEKSRRKVTPYRLGYGITPYHTTPQWLFHGHDLGKNAQRTFAVSDMQIVE